MTAKEIMEATNKIIKELFWCDDEDFVELITSAIVNGDEITEEEMEEFL